MFNFTRLNICQNAQSDNDSSTLRWLRKVECDIVSIFIHWYEWTSLDSLLFLVRYDIWEANATFEIYLHLLLCTLLSTFSEPLILALRHVSIYGWKGSGSSSLLQSWVDKLKTRVTITNNIYYIICEVILSV